jgi:hypothetical protein
MNNEEFKLYKKKYTKDNNTFCSDVLKFFKKKRREFDKKSLSDIAREELYTLPPKSDISFAYRELYSYTSFCYPNRFNNMDKLNKDIDSIKGTKAFPFIRLLVDMMYPRAIELLERNKEIEKIGVFLGRKNELQKALQFLRNEENKKAFDEFIFSLESWEESYIDYSDKTLVINGINYGKEAYCGVKIGRGNKIHCMNVSVCYDEKEAKYFIGVKNYTHWRNSDLVIIDVVDKIPDEVKAYFN